VSTRLLVIRHAKTESEGRCVGRTEVPVVLGHEDAAREVVRCVRASAMEIAKVWSSPIDRCARPAEVVARMLGVPHGIDARLAEIDHGRFEGRMWSELERDEAEAMARWMARWEDEGPPGGESAREVERRVRQWWDALGDENALLVAHAGVARALRVVIGGVSWREAMGVAVPHLAVDAVHTREA
jgi:alpha-ribazole phosphatase